MAPAASWLSDIAARICDAVVLARPRRRGLLAIAAGCASALAFAPVFASPILFVTFPVLVWLIDAAPTVRAAAWSGWCFAFGYFFFNLFWIGEAFLVEPDKFAVFLPLAVTVLPAGLALFWAAACALARWFWSPGVARIFTFAACLSAAEWLRGHLFTGLPWNVPGYALTAPVELMQGAALVGIYGLTAFAFVIFTAPLVVFGDREFATRRSALAWTIALTLAPLVALGGFGIWRLSQVSTDVAGVRLRIVQPSVLQTEKWRPEHQRRIFEDHLALSATNAAGARDELKDITHVVWPEAAMPFLPLESADAMAAIGTLLPDGVTLIAGALRRELPAVDANATTLSRPPLFNSMLVFDAAGQPAGSYDKIHLVPFGEYLPFERILSAIGLKKLTDGLGAFAVGQEPRPLMTIAGLPPVTALICYEALFPGDVVQSQDSPGLLINVTNDGWFGNTSGPRQHFHQTRVRAVEEGVPLIRAANNGISAVVDRNGRVRHRLDMNVRGVIDSGLPGGAAPTFYAMVKDAPFALIIIVFAAVALSLSRTGGSRRLRAID